MTEICHSEEVAAATDEESREQVIRLKTRSFAEFTLRTALLRDGECSSTVSAGKASRLAGSRHGGIRMTRGYGLRVASGVEQDMAATL